MGCHLFFHSWKTVHFHRRRLLIQFFVFDHRASATVFPFTFSLDSLCRCFGNFSSFRELSSAFCSAPLRELAFLFAFHTRDSHRFAFFRASHRKHILLGPSVFLRHLCCLVHLVMPLYLVCPSCRMIVGAMPLLHRMLRIELCLQ